jgi:hypothetical protein
MHCLWVERRNKGIGPKNIFKKEGELLWLSGKEVKMRK